MAHWICLSLPYHSNKFESQTHIRFFKLYLLNFGEIEIWPNFNKQTNRSQKFVKLFGQWLFVSQLVEWSLSTQEVCSLNLVISNSI